MAADLLLRQVKLMGREGCDVLIRDGMIHAIASRIDADDVECLDADGAILVPGLVEAHTHLDKTLLGTPWYRNEVGPSLENRISNERRLRRELGLDPQEQATRQALLSISQGSTHIRSHVDVDAGVDGLGLAPLHGMVATREQLREVVDIEIVAFPQSGLLSRPGTLAMMEEALREGATVVGGIDPAGIDQDPKGHLDAVFGLAERYGMPLDIHLHEPAELGAFSMEQIIARTKALGMQGRVTIAHAFCLGMADRSYVARLIDGLAEAGVHIMTTGPSGRIAPPVKQLREAGVLVCGGSDGVRDAWGPYGNADMLERAMFIGLANNLRRDDEIEMALDVCTHGGAKVLSIANYGLEEGACADLVLLEGETLADAVVTRSPRRVVIKRGRVVARDGVCLAG